MNQAGTAGGQSVVGYFKAELDGTRYDAAIHTLEQRFFSQAGEPCRSHSLELLLLQFHQDSSYTSHVPRHGRWRYRSAVERRGLGCPLGSLRAVEGGKRGVNESACANHKRNCGFHSINSKRFGSRQDDSLPRRHADCSLHFSWHHGCGRGIFICWCVYSDRWSEKFKVAHYQAINSHKILCRPSTILLPFLIFRYSCARQPCSITQIPAAAADGASRNGTPFWRSSKRVVWMPL